MHISSPSRIARPPWRLIIFALVLLGALFPVGWLSTLNPVAAAIDDLLFATDLSHAIAHGLLFFAVGMGTLAAFPALRRMPVRFFVLMLLLGVAQEAFQLLYKQRPIGFDEYRDLATDATGYVVAFALARWRMKVAQARHDNNPFG